MQRQQSAVEILLQIREDLRGLTATNAGMAQLRANMANTAKAAQQQARTISSEFDGVGKSIKAAFSPANLTKGLLSVAGIGGGLALVNLTVSKWAEVWQQSAQYAAEVQDRAERIAAAMKEASKAARESFIGGLSPERQREMRVNEASALEARMRALEARRSGSLGAAGWASREALNSQLGVLSNFNLRVSSYGGESFGPNGMGGRDFFELMTKRADDAQSEWAELSKQLTDARDKIANLDRQIADAAKRRADETNRAAEQAKAALLEVSKLYTQTWGAMERNYVAALGDADGNDFDARRAAIEDLFYTGKIGAEAASRALKELDADQQRWTENAQQAAIKHLKKWAEVFGMIEDAGRTQAAENNAEYAAERAAQAAERMGFAFQSAFEDAILSGKKFSDVLRALARDIAQIALRKAITEPLGNAVGGFISSIFAAGGGTFMTNGPTQLTVGDNPGGMELVSVLPISGVGRTRTSGNVVKMAGGGALLAGGGAGREISIVQNLNIATGVAGTVRAEIMAMMPTFRELARDSVREGLARGDL